MPPVHGALAAPMRLVASGLALPTRVVTTRELVEALPSGRAPEAVQARIGIRERRWLGPGESVASLATAAVRQALDRARMAPTDLDRLILVTSTGGDHLVPATANTVLRSLGLSDSCDGFDLNNTCTGFLTGLDLAARCVATGSGPVAVVAAEAFSRYLRPEVPRSWLVMGDAAAAVIVAPARGRGGIRARWLRNRADLSAPMTTPHPGLADDRVGIVFDAPAGELGANALRSIRQASERVLGEAGLGWEAVDRFLPHQPNGVLFEEILAGCGVPPERAAPPVAVDCGSLGAAAVAVGLARLDAMGGLGPRDRLLLATVGVGTAYGALLVEGDG